MTTNVISSISTKTPEEAEKTTNNNHSYESAGTLPPANSQISKLPNPNLTAKQTTILSASPQDQIASFRIINNRYNQLQSDLIRIIKNNNKQSFLCQHCPKLVLTFMKIVRFFSESFFKQSIREFSEKNSQLHPSNKELTRNSISERANQFAEASIASGFFLIAL